MACHNHFVIRNELSQTLTLNLEPEGAFYPLRGGEKVTVREEFTASPVSITLTSSDNGDPILSIWPGDGEMRVEKDGVDLLDLLQRDAGVALRKQ